MTSKTGSWLAAEGSESAVVLSSRVRLARNVKGLIYPPYADADSSAKVVDFVEAAVKNSRLLSEADFYRSDAIDDLDRSFLIERHLISPEFMKSPNISGLCIDQDERLAIMINEEDHLRIQSLCSGLCLRKALDQAMDVDNELSTTLEFDYDTDFGFLTSCPTNVGTGMRASVLIHLAGLVLTKEIDSVIDHITRLGMVVRGFYGEGTDVWGNLFQICNQTTLGRGESEIADALEKVTRQIIEFENKARERMIADAKDEISDKIWRAYGILKNARVLTSEETMNLLSAVRVGIALDIFDVVSVKTVNELLLMSQPAHLQKHVGAALSPAERDVARAQLVRERLSGG